MPMNTMSKDVGVGAVGAIDSKLPPPMQDRDIEGQFSRIGTAIMNHAQSYFAPGSAQQSRNLDAAAVAQLDRALGPSSPINGQTLASMLSNPRSRVAAARFLLGWTILESIRPTTMPEYTLLPPELAECMQTMTLSYHEHEGGVGTELIVSRCHQS